MARLDFESVVLAVIVVAGALAIGGAGYEWLMQTKVERACLRAGWPHGDFRWIGPDYCIKRVDQTDVVIPLDSLAR